MKKKYLIIFAAILIACLVSMLSESFGLNADGKFLVFCALFSILLVALFGRSTIKSLKKIAENAKVVSFKPLEDENI